jgi:hypothetical protein
MPPLRRDFVTGRPRRLRGTISSGGELARIDIAFAANHTGGIHPSDLRLIPSLLASMDIQ